MHGAGMHSVLAGKPEATTKKTGVDGRVILKWILDKWDRLVWTLDQAQNRDH
jgi:hypothetical protein